jgi:hypothetical protein
MDIYSPSIEITSSCRFTVAQDAGHVVGLFYCLVIAYSTFASCLNQRHDGQERAGQTGQVTI